MSRPLHRYDSPAFKLLEAITPLPFDTDDQLDILQKFLDQAYADGYVDGMADEEDATP